MQQTYALADLPKVAARLLERYGTGRVYALEGDLGAGKTTLVSECCRRLGVEGETSSPTFSIVNEYRTATGPVYHLDAYRLESVEEALNAGLEDIFEGEGYPVFVEWPRVIQPLLPPDVVWIRLAHAPDGSTRQIAVSTGHPDEENER